MSYAITLRPGELESASSTMNIRYASAVPDVINGRAHSMAKSICMWYTLLEPSCPCCPQRSFDA